MSTLTELLSKGYFPKELPPAFTTASFARFVSSRLFAPDICMVAPRSNGNLDVPERGMSNCCRHNLARLDGTNRTLAIPHPVHSYALSNCISNNYAFLRTHLKKSKLSITIPKKDTRSKRALIPSRSGVARPKLRLADRAKGDFLLTTDVSDFYGRLYSHSIPWALHSKPFAKQNRGLNHIGNIFDALLRNSQDGQTMGIPVGPDTSLLVSELVMAAIDQTMQAKYTGLVGFRFYDDYEIVCPDEATAQRVLADLEDCLDNFELSINRRKTRIVRLPETVDLPWVAVLRDFKLPEFSRDVEDRIVDFANLAFPLAKIHPHDPVLRYALIKLATGKPDESLLYPDYIDEDDLYSPYAGKEIYQDFLINVFRAEPHLSHIVAGELLRYKDNGGKLNLELIGNAITSHILRYSSTKSGNEVAWALWLAIYLDVPLNEEVGKQVSRNNDNVVAILSLDAREKGLFKRNLDTTSWEGLISQSEIYSENWLLCYEAAAHGWLPITDGSDYINRHRCFGALNQNGVRFYDSASYNRKRTVLRHLEINQDLYSM
jgi:hypothetical protein